MLEFFLPSGGIHYFTLTFRHMQGVEYMLLHTQEPILYIIRKQHRYSPTQVTPLANYHIIGGQVFQTPDLGSIINSKVVSWLSNLLWPVFLCYSLQFQGNISVVFFTRAEDTKLWYDKILLGKFSLWLRWVTPSQLVIKCLKATIEKSNNQSSAMVLNPPKYGNCPLQGLFHPLVAVRKKSYLF